MKEGEEAVEVVDIIVLGREEDLRWLRVVITVKYDGGGRVDTAGLGVDRLGSQESTLLGLSLILLLTQVPSLNFQTLLPGQIIFGSQ
jgi:hypothetical protein